MWLYVCKYVTGHAEANTHVGLITVFVFMKFLC
jgi:hypothetical protein